MITVEELSKCKKASDELIEAVKQYILKKFSDYYDCPNVEDNFELEINGISYTVLENEDSGWTDNGKYSYADATYQLISIDKCISKYVTEKSIIDRFDLFINQEISRCGSYFSSYDYQYFTPIIQTATVIYVPEIVIEAHEEVKFISK